MRSRLERRDGDRNKPTLQSPTRDVRQLGVKKKKKKTFSGSFSDLAGNGHVVIIESRNAG